MNVRLYVFYIHIMIDLVEFFSEKWWEWSFDLGEWIKWNCSQSYQLHWIWTLSGWSVHHLHGLRISVVSMYNYKIDETVHRTLMSMGNRRRVGPRVRMHIGILWRKSQQLIYNKKIWGLKKYILMDNYFNTLPFFSRFSTKLTKN